MPCAPGPSDADASNPHLPKLVDRREAAADKDVDWFGRHCRDDGDDVVPRADAGREQAVGAGFRVRGEPADRFGQVGAPDDESFGSRGQQCARSTLVNRMPGRLNSLNCQREIEQRVGAIAGGIFDRESGEAGGRRTCDVGGDGSRRDPKAAFEVGADRHVHALDDRSDMREGLIQRDPIVRAPERPGESRAGSGKGREPEPCERARTADIPWVRDHEATRCVEAVERFAAIGIRCHGSNSSCTRWCESSHYCFGGGVGRFLNNSGYTYPAGNARSGSGRTLRYVT